MAQNDMAKDIAKGLGSALKSEPTTLSDIQQGNALQRFMRRLSRKEPRIGRLVLEFKRDHTVVLHPVEDGFAATVGFGGNAKRIAMGDGDTPAPYYIPSSIRIPAGAIIYPHIEGLSTPFDPMKVRVSENGDEPVPLYERPIAVSDTFLAGFGVEAFNAGKTIGALSRPRLDMGILILLMCIFALVGAAVWLGIIANDMTHAVQQLQQIVAGASGRIL